MNGEVLNKTEPAEISVNRLVSDWRSGNDHDRTMGVVDHIGTHRTQQQALEAAETSAPDDEKIDFVRQIDQPPTRVTVIRHPLDTRKRSVHSSGHGVDNLVNESVSLRTNQLKLCGRYDFRSRTPKQLPDIDRSDEITLRRVLDRPPQRVTRRI
jgi:hypothetical protein